MSKWKILYAEFFKEGADHQLNIEDDVKSQLSEMNDIIIKFNCMNLSCHDCLNRAAKEIFDNFHTILTTNFDLLDTVKVAVQHYVLAETNKSLVLESQGSKDKFTL